MSKQDFGKAAQRHYRDACALMSAHDPIERSVGVSHVAGADHLAGFAAECAIKQILVEFLGVPCPTNGAPRADGQTFGHFPRLWHEISLFLEH